MAGHQLPPELWRHVFHHLTYVPGSLIPEIYAHTSLGPLQSTNTALHQSRNTILPLTLVCKQWWHLAIPYLYQSVHVGNSNSLCSLCSSLRSSAAGKGTAIDTQPLGEYTQRLDIAVRSQAITADAISELITYIPNLAIVSFAIPSNYAITDLVNNVMAAIQQSPLSLRVLDWSLTQLEPSPSRIVTLLSKCTQLRVLNCTRLVWSKELERGGIPPTVTTLRIHGLISVENAVADGQLPNIDPCTLRHDGPTALQELILDLNRDVFYWKDLLEVYKDQLVSIQLCIPNLYLIDFDGHLKLLTQICPRLQRLTVTTNRFSCLMRSCPVLPSIEYLGLRTPRLQSHKSELETLFGFLERLPKTVPSLKVVQLMDDQSVQHMLDTHGQFAMHALQPLGEVTSLRVEDKDGILLTGSRSSPWMTVLVLINLGVIRQVAEAWKSVKGRSAKHVIGRR